MTISTKLLPLIIGLTLRAIVRAARSSRGAVVAFVLLGGLASSASAQTADPLRNVPIAISYAGDDATGQAFVDALRRQIASSPVYSLRTFSTTATTITIGLASVPVHFEDETRELGAAVSYSIVVTYKDPTSLPTFLDSGVYVVRPDGVSAFASDLVAATTRNVRDFRTYIRAYNEAKRAERDGNN